jgi:hypothetical protein
MSSFLTPNVQNSNSHTNAAVNSLNKFSFFSALMGLNSISPNVSPSKSPNLVSNGVHVKANSFVRNYCAGKNGEAGSGEWTEDIEYLDESGSVIYSGKGIR